MRAKVPNLELILYKAQEALASDSEFLEALNKKRQEGNVNYVAVEFDVTVFSQIWGSTCTGFDIMPDGSPALGGCAMTKEYTTIVHELATDCYCVFFGDRPCYKVTNANTAFFEDMLKHRMASLSEAKKRY